MSAISAVLRRGGGRDDEKSPSIRYRQGFRLKNWPFSTTLQRDDHGAFLWPSCGPRRHSGVSRLSDLWLHRVSESLTLSLTLVTRPLTLAAWQHPSSTWAAARRTEQRSSTLRPLVWTRLDPFARAPLAVATP